MLVHASRIAMSSIEISCDTVAFLEPWVAFAISPHNRPRTLKIIVIVTHQRNEVPALTAVSCFYSNRTLVVNSLHEDLDPSVSTAFRRTKQDKNIAETATNCACKRNCSIARRAFIHELYRGISPLKSWGDRRDSNPQQPEPQSGALPLSYGHHARHWPVLEVCLNSIFPGTLSTGIFKAS